MSKVTLYISHDERIADPEGEPCWAALTEYDPNDPESLLRAREAVRAHFSLKYLPALCNEPEPSFFEMLWRGASRWLERKPSGRSKAAARAIA